MQKYRAEILVPDNCDWQTIEDAKSKAEWKRIFTNEERMARTNLDGKCGSCKSFCHKDCFDGKTAYGRCKIKDTLRERSQKACKTFYEKDGTK